mgnify:CR=1 FL=1
MISTTSGNIEFNGSGGSWLSINSSGNVGIWTSSPNANLTINTSSLNPNSNGYNAQNAWISIQYNWWDTPGSEWNGIYFTQHYVSATVDSAQIRTWGIIGYKSSPSGSFWWWLKFKIQPYSATPMLTAMTINNSSQLDIWGSHIHTWGYDLLRFSNLNGQVGAIRTTWASTSYNTSSDYRLKENVTPISSATERLNALKPVRFNFKADKNETVDGFLAHEVQEVVPEAVSGEKDWVDEEGKPEYQAMDYAKVTPLLTAALQEALKAIEILKKEVELLKKQ